MKLLGVVFVGVSEAKIESNVRLVPSSELLGIELYCNFCKSELLGWSEGCLLHHLRCEKCNISYIFIDLEYLGEQDRKKLISNLEEILYKYVLNSNGEMKCSEKE